MKQYIIIDKNVETTKKITHAVNRFEDIIFSGSANNENQGLSLIFKTNPDIIFLDIDNTIKNLSEFLLDVSQHLNNQPVFVALSSSKMNAYNAYRHDFFDYLLKPLTELSVYRSISKYRKKYPNDIYEMICLRSNKDYQYLNTDEILFLKADNNTTDFHMKDGSVVGAYKTLKTFENVLPENFLRIHKSYIINSKRISRIHYGKAICIIKNPSYTIPFTKTFIQNIDSINNTLSNKAFIALN